MIKLKDLSVGDSFTFSDYPEEGRYFIEAIHPEIKSYYCRNENHSLQEFYRECGGEFYVTDVIYDKPGSLGESREEDMVNSPSHYTAGGIETIEVIKAKLSEEEFAGYCKGNAIKYLTRANYKGSNLQDLQKASWYINDLLKRVNNG